MLRADAARRDRMRLRAGLAWLGLLLASDAARGSMPGGQPSTESPPSASRRAAERALPGVVTVRAEGPGPLSGPDRPSPPGVAGTGGSGVVIDAGRGLVLTDDLVVDEALRGGGMPVVELPDGRVRSALDARRDPRSGLALLSIDPTGLELVAIDWGDPEGPGVGDPVLAVGMAYGLPGTVSAGIVGGLGRTLAPGPHRDLIQADAAIAPGGAGGALVDLEGRLVGINIAVPAAGGRLEAVGFAVPARRARRVADDLAAFGRVRRSAIGVRVGQVDPELAATLDPPGAVRVEAVTPGGPADRAGLAPGDLIVSVGGHPASSPDRLISAVEFAPGGEPLAVRVVRDGRDAALEVRPEPQAPGVEDPIGPIAVAGPAGPTPAGTVTSPPTASRGPRLPEPPTSRDPTRFPGLGLRLEGSSAGLAGRFGFDPGVSGVVIVGISPGGPADLGGLVPGMVVTDVLDRPVGSLADFREAVATAPPDRDLILRVLNGGRAEFRVILRLGQGDRAPGGGA